MANDQCSDGESLTLSGGEVIEKIKVENRLERVTDEGQNDEAVSAVVERKTRKNQKVAKREAGDEQYRETVTRRAHPDSCKRIATRSTRRRGCGTLRRSGRLTEPSTASPSSANEMSTRFSRISATVHHDASVDQHRYVARVADFAPDA